MLAHLHPGTHAALKMFLGMFKLMMMIERKKGREGVKKEGRKKERN